MPRHSKLLLVGALTMFGALATGALVVSAILDPDHDRDRRGCFIGQPPPRTLVIALDVSDPLVAAHPREVAFDVERGLQSLDSGDRVLAIDAFGKMPSEVVPVVDQCDPGNDDNTARNTFRDKIVNPIMAHVKAARSHPSASESPIVETIISAASDPSVRGPNTQLAVQFITDGLQNSRFESAYRDEPFPVAPKGLLSGITVDLDIVKNERDAARQPRAVKRLVAWLEAAGAKVAYTPPSWLLLTDVWPRPRHGVER